MSKTPSQGIALLLFLLLFTVPSFAQIVNPSGGSGGGGGDVFTNKANTYTVDSLNDFSSSGSFIPPSAATDPSGNCASNATLFENYLSGSLFACVAGKWTKVTSGLSSIADINGGLATYAYVDASPSGFLGKSYNLMTMSTAVGSGTGWGTFGPVVVTQNATGATAPDDTSTATKLQSGGGTADQIRYTFVPSVSGTYTASIWAKAGNYNTFAISFWDNTSSVGLGQTTITNLDQSWKRFSITTNLPATVGHTILVVINPSDGSTSPAGSYVYVWGSQLVLSTVPSPFVRTGATAQTGLTLAGVSTNNINVNSASGNYNLNLPALPPVTGQVLSVTGVSGQIATLGWSSASSPVKQVSWQIADPTNDLTATSGTAPNLAVNLSGSAWTIVSVYCVSDSVTAATFQLTTGGTNIGPSGGFTCSSSPSTVTTGFTTGSIANNATVSQSLMVSAVGMKHMTVVLRYQ